MTQEIELILASSSPRRQALLRDAGVVFIVLKPEIDESQYKGESPLDYVKRLSREKAETIDQIRQNHLPILAADTVVILAADIGRIEQDGEILGKPADADEARNMLRRLRAKPHVVCTAFTILAGGDRPKLLTQEVKTIVTMRDYSDEEIEAYIATRDPFDKAGGYAIQHEEFHPVEQIEGSYSNVVGLPIEEVREALKQFGV